jgi:hypothetical protein
VRPRNGAVADLARFAELYFLRVYSDMEYFGVDPQINELVGEEVGVGFGQCIIVGLFLENGLFGLGGMILENHVECCLQLFQTILQVGIYGLMVKRLARITRMDVLIPIQSIDFFLLDINSSVRKVPLVIKLVINPKFLA